MLKSSKPGLTEKSKPAVATKKVAAKPVTNPAKTKSMLAIAANKTDVRAAGSAGKSKPAAATGKIAARPASNSMPASQARGTGDGADRQEMIAIAAYYRAERRSFDGGDLMLDWLEAEAEIDAAVYH